MLFQSHVTIAKKSEWNFMLIMRLRLKKEEEDNQIQFDKKN